MKRPDAETERAKSVSRSPDGFANEPGPAINGQERVIAVKAGTDRSPALTRNAELAVPLAG